MGVGDYVHSKEAGAPRAPADLPPSQRQLRAEQAKVEVPTQYLSSPSGNGRFIARGLPRSPGPSERLRTLPENQAPENGMHRDLFDTDVEGIDDSTIAEASLFGFSETHSQAPSTVQAGDENTSPRPSYLPRPTRRSYRSSFYGGLGEKALKKAGFDTSDDGEDTASQLTSSLGADDEKTEEMPEPARPPEPAEPTQPVEPDNSSEPRESSGWYLPHKHRAADEPLSKRLENFWAASKRTSKSVDQIQTEVQQQAHMGLATEHQPRKLGHMLPPTGPRKITLPHSISATPRTRFSPPKPSLLDQLDISPTRHGSEPPPQAGRMLSLTSYNYDQKSEDESEHEHGIDETIRVISRRQSGHSLHPFDITNLSDLGRENDEMIQDPFLSQPPSARRGRRNTVIHTKKRQLEADYPPQLLYQKSFTDLQAEPFEKAPTPPPVKSPPLPLNTSLSDAQSSNDTVSQLLKLPDQGRQTYLSRMSVDEWENCGDQLIDRFSNLLTEMKKLRQARRRTAAVFEAEVKRRHDLIDAQNSELSTKLDEMRTGGAEVLRGRNG
ncbi:hypothetical protein N7462_011300 [Penicillium macrosclerotiorum]|uniref:uncharacterized protein n=1 Tax=Penicillium macrosclerotiorum TaxID=303699 RepID=UPI0025469602|nr:uncharacterized protein N7462_011300 [Penicillium macrosclerotiorum]KAJ5666891.1 hypothetical protein N7462_011300 [Penicillium macrosclerotiorum]